MPRSRPTRDAPARAPARSGWDGHEHCGFCLQSYELALERHCVHCDRPICPICIDTVTVRATLLCPDCVAEGGADAEETG